MFTSFKFFAPATQEFAVQVGVRELSLDELATVSGGALPHGSWAISPSVAVVDAPPPLPHGTW